MAKRRPRPIRVLPEGSLPPGVKAIPLGWLVGDGPRRRPGPDDPARDRLWRQLRLEVEELFVCTPLDLRCYLPADTAQREALDAARLAQLEAYYAADERVTLAAGVVH